ncbi:hypothetical protein H9Y04_42160 [Streptomyces sp. TRM66268-LWL]|uniref:Serine/threonine protein kinase n=1 Tax=Streptomyces polyasparticus TaxID=2767826 RepID=A0ABR7SUG0_9ACTN|nr:hypothetical protein [Streptomyces polyasparticus]MBC9719136.1 hypothetical protein [Streptomyces polyasparticus]
MAPQVIPITLTPQQAATGVTFTLNDRGTPIQIQVPPCRNGDMIPAYLAGNQVFLKIVVGNQPGAARTRPAWGCFGALLVIGALVVGGLILVTKDDDDPADAKGGTTTPPATSAPATPGTETPTESAPPDPFTEGTCLNGELPDSDTPQDASGVEEVECSASDAHYKVIQTFPFTSDMSSCDANPKTEYAYSSRQTLNGATINEYVYCLVGLGSYARS